MEAKYYKIPNAGCLHDIYFKIHENITERVYVPVSRGLMYSYSIDNMLTPNLSDDRLVTEREYEVAYRLAMYKLRKNTN